MITIRTKQFFDDTQSILQSQCIAGRKGLGRKIIIPQIQRPGLALTGDPAPLNPGRIQILGNSELRYLNKLKPVRRSFVLKKICETKLCCFVITNGKQPPEQLITQANKFHTPLLTTALNTATAIVRIQRYLADNLAEKTSAHGVLMDVAGIGVLLMGKSGIGKSECALELVMRGHRLVADDIVKIHKRHPDALIGSGAELIQYHMEIRGLGIINIKDLFGVGAVREQKVIELIIELVEWKPKQTYERIGINDKTMEILDQHIPAVTIPIRPGRSLSAIIEVAARNQLLKLKGIHSAREFQEQLTKKLLTGSIKKK